MEVLNSYNPQGCQIVAGGRSAAETSGGKLIGSHPERVPLSFERFIPITLLPFQDADQNRFPGVCDHRLLSRSPSGCHAGRAAGLQSYKPLRTMSCKRINP